MDALVLGDEGPVELPAWVQKRSWAFDPCYKPSDLDFILDFSPARRRFPSTCLRSLICLIPRLTSLQASAFLGGLRGKLLLQGQPKAPHRAALLHGEKPAAPLSPLLPSPQPYRVSLDTGKVASPQMSFLSFLLHHFSLPGASFFSAEPSGKGRGACFGSVC